MQWFELRYWDSYRDRLNRELGYVQFYDGEWRAQAWDGAEFQRIDTFESRDDAKVWVEVTCRG